MIKADLYYKKNLENILNNGYWDENPRPKYRDGQIANTKFITQVFEEYDISSGEFPITTLRNTSIKTGIREIFWIYQRQTSSLEDARELNINWWDSWDIGNNTIGQRYGATINRYDLMNRLLNSLKNDPFSRRHILTMYQEKDLLETDGLYPCAYETIWSVRKNDNKYYLDMTLVQRSSDFIVANFINKTQYLALQMMVASHLDYNVGKFCHFVQNLHIYDRHFDAANEILNKNPLEIQPSIRIINNKNFYDFTINDFEILGVENIQKISANLEIAV